MRETNTMPQWAGSCWYYLAFANAGMSNLKFANREKGTEREYWMGKTGVDLYVGGAEHATRHLIYARFWHKFLYDIDVVSTKEPFAKLETVGLIWGSDGRKMGKRYGNAVDPNTVVDRFGADSFRIYEMFLGPFGDTVLWSDAGIVGPRRFMERVWALRDKVKSETTSVMDYEMTEAIKKVATDIEKFRFNTAISKLMVLSRDIAELDTIPTDLYENYLKLLAPFAPHITEELWASLGHEDSIHKSLWPTAKEGLAQILSDVVTIPVQIDGKIRGKVIVSRGAPEAEVREAIMASKGMAQWLPG